MARRNIRTGIDIGTSNVRVIIAEYTDDHALPIIIGTGLAESKGLRHGYISHHEEAGESIRKAIEQAERAANVDVKRAFVAVGGISLESVMGTGSTFISRGDAEVTEKDVDQVIEASLENIGLSPNKEIIHQIPLEFKLDGETVLGRPEGMRGARLEAKTLFVTCLRQHLQDFVHAVEGCGVQVDDISPSPIAASFVALTKNQRIAGCVLANIGAETLSISIFEGNIPVSLKVFPIGGAEITNDIALGLKIPLDEAEDLKRGKTLNNYKKRLESIIEARLSDIFDLIESHLKKIGKSGLLPAGIILTGGSAAIPLIDEIAKDRLSLPSKVTLPDFAKNTKDQIRSAEWAVAYGLCIMGGDDGDSRLGLRISKRGFAFLDWFKQFLP